MVPPCVLEMLYLLHLATFCAAFVSACFEFPFLNATNATPPLLEEAQAFTHCQQSPAFYSSTGCQNKNRTAKKAVTPVHMHSTDVHLN